MINLLILAFPLLIAILGLARILNFNVHLGRYSFEDLARWILAVGGIIAGATLIAQKEELTSKLGGVLELLVINPALAASNDASPIGPWVPTIVIFYSSWGLHLLSPWVFCYFPSIVMKINLGSRRLIPL
jgi:hypothetical protein